VIVWLEALVVLWLEALECDDPSQLGGVVIGEMDQPIDKPAWKAALVVFVLFKPVEVDGGQNMICQVDIGRQVAPRRTSNTLRQSAISHGYDDLILVLNGLDVEKAW
jgi:hypothetical protein